MQAKTCELALATPLPRDLEFSLADSDRRLCSKGRGYLFAYHLGMFCRKLGKPVSSSHRASLVFGSSELRASCRGFRLV